MPHMGSIYPRMEGVLIQYQRQEPTLALNATTKRYHQTLALMGATRLASGKYAVSGFALVPLTAGDIRT